MNKEVKCGPRCRCRNSSNAPSATTSAAHLHVDVLELEEELVPDYFLRRECGEELVIEDNPSISEDDKEDTVMLKSHFSVMDFSPSFPLPFLSLPAFYPYLPLSPALVLPAFALPFLHVCTVFLDRCLSHLHVGAVWNQTIVVYSSYNLCNALPV